MKIRNIVPVLFLGTIATSAFLSACGIDEEAKKASEAENGAGAGGEETGGQVEKAKGSLSLTDIQLKSASLLATHTENVFGPGMDLAAAPVAMGGNNRNNNNAPKSVFVVYQNNFGSESGLRVGDKFADGPTESYFMGLAIAGETVARNCQNDVLNKAEESKCYCATEEKAEELLGRAFSHWDFSTGERKAFVKKIAEGCAERKTYKATINGMVMSLAFALRR
jgi:hypothetical protein